jgi:gluconate 2-dehydrogenase gamma chain
MADRQDEFSRGTSTDLPGGQERSAPASVTTAPPGAQSPDPGRGTSRRSLLKLLGAGAVGAAVGAGVTLVAGDNLRPASSPAAVATPPLRFFNDAQARTITAMAERIFPKDSVGPGATDAHVINYIDGRLAGAWGMGARTYRQGPYLQPADSGHGFQLAMTPRDIYKDALAALDAYTNAKYAKPFDNLSTQQQDDTLHALDGGTVDTFTIVPAATFFAMFRANVVEGLFADPLYGGNFNMIGWRWIGFSGNPMAYGDPYGNFIDKFDTPYNVEPKPLE